MKTTKNNYGFGPIYIEGMGYAKVIGMVGYPVPTQVRLQFKDGKESGFTGRVVDYDPIILRELNTVKPLI